MLSPIPTQTYQQLLPTPFFQELTATISVDIETAGPNPHDFPLLSIGACTLFHPRQTFYTELQPIVEGISPHALAVSGLSLDTLRKEGLPPQTAMQQFEGWLQSSLPQGVKPVFAAFNAPFDWSFINDYFHRFLQHNPFGHNALDMRTYFMAVKGTTWQNATFTEASHHYLGQRALQHHALQDALDQADLFLQLILDRYTQKGNENVT